MYSNNVSIVEEIFPLLSKAKLLVGQGHQRQETGEICFQSEKTHDGNRERPRYAITRQHSCNILFTFVSKFQKLL